jgi:predicted amidophosphoribosyltransferase
MVSMKFFNAILMQKTNYYKRAISQFPLEAVHVGRLYDASMQRRLHRFKFVHNHIDSPYFATLFRSLIVENELTDTENLIIVYPPISTKDRVLRWPNHAHELAKIVAKILGTKHILCPFKKKFFAGHQSQRNKKQRQRIQWEYSFKERYRESVKGRDILFIDDLITTGYTAHTLCTFLKKAGSKKIVGLFLSSHKV